jgi:metal-responsive CopG/Arc/MetJ family transcriptional regulator
MKRTTIFADEMLIEEIKTISKEENRSTADVLREAMEHYIREKKKGERTLSFVGIGKSGKKKISEKHEDLLWKKDTQ